MIGTKLYQKKSRALFFIAMYGVLALIGLGFIVFSVLRDKNPASMEGFTFIFGAGMAFLTWLKSRKASIAVHEEYLELNQQRKPLFVKYKSISNVTRTKDNRLVIAVREGHDIKNMSIWLKDLEDADADKLVEFCRKKKWKSQ